MNKINIVLFEPEIAENTGNIARTCVGFGLVLHLIRPYGFFLDKNKLARSSANHWNKLKYYEYNCFDEFIEKNNHPNIYIYSRYGKLMPDDINYTKNEIFVMFGKESSGIPMEILKKYEKNLIRIPTTSDIRSLNLSNTVAIASYEIIRQLKYKNLCKNEPHKKDYLK